ncbi:hypothetical protein D8674_022451 [Pyrus ussuriensis x Pyrus communis]|uniref:Uncharacterized protein n=1 Tax=Pyrus ussuriensis x Pyrus communis TaxID=2448454 RepID=A0A5N5GM23_9ROSA|nr:hypothetical protein D8674_022451 [Pyrus ussuriensis x Pyrus communis]
MRFLGIQYLLMLKQCNWVWQQGMAGRGVIGDRWSMRILWACAIGSAVSLYMVAVDRQLKNRERALAEELKAMEAESGSGEPDPDRSIDWYQVCEACSFPGAPGCGRPDSSLDWYHICHSYGLVHGAGQGGQGGPMPPESSSYTANAAKLHNLITL